MIDGSSLFTQRRNERHEKSVDNESPNLVRPPLPMIEFPPAPLDYLKRMPLQTEAGSLERVGDDVFGRELWLSPEAAKAWRMMWKAAIDEAVDLLPLSGFRSVARQTEIVRKKLGHGLSLEEILQQSAYPGYSEHHTGRAIDIGASGFRHLEEEFELSPGFVWLTKNAGRFGFHMSYPRGNAQGLAYEPWHWCWSGREQSSPGTTKPI